MSGFEKVAVWSYAIFMMGDVIVSTTTPLTTERWQVINFLNKHYGSGNWYPATLQRKEMDVKKKKIVYWNGQKERAE